MSKNISGFGLGLFIVRKIVESQGGLIQVQSEVGVGSTFTVVLPLKPKSWEEPDDNSHTKGAQT